MEWEGETILRAEEKTYQRKGRRKLFRERKGIRFEMRTNKSKEVKILKGEEKPLKGELGRDLISLVGENH